jgi:putative tricarboxylic transport membrane protein
MRSRNLISAIVLLTLGAGYALLTANLPTRAIENTTQPSFFPTVVVVLLLALSAILLVQGIFAIGANSVPEALKIPARKYLIGFIAFVIYLVLLPILGFIVANILIFAVLMMLYGERRPVWIVGGSVLVSVAMFFLFREVFQIRLPGGVLESLVS